RLIPVGRSGLMPRGSRERNPAPRLKIVRERRKTCRFGMREGHRMADIDTGAAKRHWVRDIAGYQWLVVFIAWAGWSLDITDFTLYTFVLRSAVTELLGGSATMAQIGSVGGWLTTIGLLGWMFGGFFFGIIADYIGRVRTLALSILIYSVF